MWRIKKFLREIKYAWQRATRGYDDVACWSYDYWFTKMSSKIIKQLADNHCGYPHGLTDEKWTEILNRLTFLLNEVNEDTCSVKNEFEESYHNSLDLYIELNKALPNANFPNKFADDYFEKEKEIFEYRNKCKDEALDLIKEYFWNLWD